MNKAYALLAGLLAGLFLGDVAGATVTEDAPATAPEFEIMSDQEVRRHRDRMAKLSNEAREAYRNSEYEKLKTRAEDQGYRLPDQPPWQEGKLDAAAKPEIHSAAADGSEAKTPPVPSEAHRATMKQRFEHYLEEREKRRAAMRPPTPTGAPSSRSNDIGNTAAERREQASKRHAEARAEQKARIQQHQEEVEARRERHRQQTLEKNEQAKARAGKRQAELLRLRAEAVKSTVETGVPTQELGKNADQDSGQVSAALARMREANAAERETLSEEAEERIAKQRGELEALRDQRDASGTSFSTATPGPESESESESESGAASGPDSEAVRQARIEQRRAEAEAHRKAFGTASASDRKDGAKSVDQAETKSVTSAKSAQARPTAPASGYYRHPVYPAVPYPAYPYYPNPYPNPYWARPR